MSGVNEVQQRLPPPYTNRFGTKPGPDYRRCTATAKTTGTRCRAAAIDGSDTCPQHREDAA